MLNQYKSNQRTQKLIAKFGESAESVMDNNPPTAGESYEDWMKRTAEIFKAQQPKKEVKYYTPELPKVRGYYTGSDGKKYREYIGGGGRVVNELVRGHDYDQYGR